MKFDYVVTSKDYVNIGIDKLSLKKEQPIKSRCANGILLLLLSAAIGWACGNTERGILIGVAVFLYSFFAVSISEKKRTAAVIEATVNNPNLYGYLTERHLTVFDDLITVDNGISRTVRPLSSIHSIDNLEHGINIVFCDASELAIPAKVFIGEVTKEKFIEVLNIGRTKKPPQIN